MKILISALLLFLLPLANAAEKALVINVKPADSTFELTLPANPTTGYQWTLKQYDKTLITLTSKRYQAPKSRLMGAGGTSVFAFKLIKNAPRPTTTRIVLRYERPWEPNSGSAKTVVVNFDNIP